MCEITIQVKCPYCNSAKVKKNGKKRTWKQNFLCRICHKQFQYVHLYNGANPSNKSLVCSMILNGSGIRDTHRVLKLNIGCILSILRNWLRQNKEPCLKGTYKQVQIDEFWTFVNHGKQGKRWVWYAYVEIPPTLTPYYQIAMPPNSILIQSLPSVLF